MRPAHAQKIAFSTVRGKVHTLRGRALWTPVTNEIAFESTTGLVWTLAPTLPKARHCFSDPNDPSTPRAFHDAQSYS
jgi:hypothetical protein